MINSLLFSRKHAATKLAMINNMSDIELLQISRDTVVKMIKKCCKGPERRFYVDMVSNEWNAWIYGIIMTDKSMVIDIYGDIGNTDINIYVPYDVFFNRYKKSFTQSDSIVYNVGGENKRFTFNFENNKKAEFIRRICIKYINTVYADKLK